MSAPFGNGNSGSGAAFGSTPSCPFFTPQNSNAFGSTPGGNSNSIFGVSTPPTFVSLSSENQSSMPSRFVPAPAPSTVPFRETSQSSTGFGSTYTSPSGQTSPSFGGFGEASYTTPVSRPQPWSLFPSGGEYLLRPGEGTRCAPYQPTPEENNLLWNKARPVLTSISAMNFYCNKSHEELRFEDYKQGNKGSSSAAHVFSSPLPNPFSVSSTNPFSVSSTNPSQPPNSPGWFPPYEPLHFTFKRSSENPFHQSTDLGGSPAIVDNSCRETRAPYQPTPAEENNLSWNNGSGASLTSISAMNCYCNKSHEELRLEDNKQIRNKGPSPAANIFEVSNPLPNPVSSSGANPFQPANSSGWFPPSGPSPFTFFNRSSENPIHRTDSSSSLGSKNNCTTPAQTTTTTVSNQTSNVNLNDLTFSMTASGIPSFVNCIIPAFGVFNINGGQSLSSSELGTPVLGFPVLIPTTLTFIPQSETHFNPRMILPNPISSASASNPAATTSSHVSPSAGVLGQQNSNSSNPAAATSSHVKLSAGVLGQQNSNSSTSASPAPTNAASSESASPYILKLPTTQYHFSTIPKGLEIIVEHLGFNPWAFKPLDQKDGQFFLCEDASDDADIFSLAEFAVEQHNAMEKEKDSKVELLKVTAACLESVNGGRYHIVVEVSNKAASCRLRCYAAVLRKNTDRPTLIVLEEWLQTPTSLLSNVI